MVAPEFQGRGIAVAATAQAIDLAKRDSKHRVMHAFPSADNEPSHAICRKLGFELLEACEFEFPKGHFMTCNDWRLNLHRQSPPERRTDQHARQAANADALKGF